ncbi:MAG: cytochrome c [Polaromonas sp.]|uniref:c-type cytochrome n=1 Tax=Polaromonas sp. TaxID=1869339 RepID=UPI001841BE4A|nr:cytochrome c [Polaromonas sp.]NMM11667.1 cytochrome c [Polaromonas sp.]
MKKVSLVCVVLLLASTTAWSQMGGGMMGSGMMGHGAANGSQTGAARSAVSGIDVFKANCASCHAGGGNAVAPGLPLRESGKLIDLKTLGNFIRHPGMPGGSAGAMPAFPESRISDRQLKQLYEYIAAEYRTARSK